MVPQGGAMCTYTTLYFWNNDRTYACPLGAVKSARRMGIRDLCLLPFQSTPLALKPTSYKADVRPAWPQQISSATLGRSCLIMGESLGKMRGALGFAWCTSKALVISFEATSGRKALFEDNARKCLPMGTSVGATGTVGCVVGSHFLGHWFQGWLPWQPGKVHLCT